MRRGHDGGGQALVAGGPSARQIPGRQATVTLPGFLSKAWDVLVEEALKCQLLCRPCHVAKGAEDRPEPTTGTYYVYWYYGCRCESCKAANARKSAALRVKRLEKDTQTVSFQ